METYRLEPGMTSWIFGFCSLGPAGICLPAPVVNDLGRLIRSVRIFGLGRELTDWEAERSWARIPLSHSTCPSFQTPTMDGWELLGSLLEVRLDDVTWADGFWWK
jgi:hypothetical protein